MTQPMELWSRPAPPDGWRPFAPPQPPQRGTRAVPYEPTPDVEHDRSCTFHSITRMPAYADRSFEQLRMEDETPGYVFRPPRVADTKSTTLLERDVLRALGEVVLNERHWWRDRHDNAAWKKKKTDIAMRVTRATLQDAAAHVVNWVAAAARGIAESVAPEELTLSLLLEHWPATSEAAYLGQQPAFPRMSSLCDRYLVLAWVVFRGICKRDAVAWPCGWGVESCSCSKLQSLVAAIAERGVQTLERLIERHDDGLDLLPEDVQSILEEEDASTTEWLVATLGESIAAIRTDMAMLEMWTTRHLYTLMSDLGLSCSSEDASVAVPAPFPNAFLVDGVAVPDTDKLFAGNGPQSLVVAFEASSENGRVELATKTDSGFDVQALETVLSSVFPAFTKMHAASSNIMSSITSHDIQLADRPGLLLGRQLTSQGFQPPDESWTPSRVIVDFETITVSATSSEAEQGDWRFNVSVPVIDSVDIDATGVICVGTTNISAPSLQIRSLSAQDDVPTISPSYELYVRSAMVPSASDTNAGIVSVSASPGRAVVIPRSTQYRVANPQLVDATKPGEFVLLRVAVVSPKCTTPSSRIESMLRESPEIPEWLEDLQLKARDKIFSAEEARFAHYQQDRKASQKKTRTALDLFTPAASFTNLSPTPRAGYFLDEEVNYKIATLMNPPQWWETRWIEGSAYRLEWERDLESYFLHKQLETEVTNGYASLVASLTATATNADEAKSDEAIARFGDGSSAFAKIANLFSRIVMLREVHQGLVPGAKMDRGKTSAQVVVDLVQQCRIAGSEEAQAQILSDFIGVGYPVASLLSPLAGIWEQVNEDVKKWVQNGVDKVDFQRQVLLHADPPGLYSPVRGTYVLDGAVAQVVKAKLVVGLEPLLCEALSAASPGATTLRLVEPAREVVVLKDIVPTFSVPRAGSIEKRLAAVIVQNETSSPTESRIRQWIPSDVAVDLDGKARFLTYISGIDPRSNRGLYESLDAIATAFVPVFEKVVSVQMEGFGGPVYRDDTEALAAQPKVFSLRGRVVQMAVEIVQIDLNAETPQYKGEDWRVDVTNQQQDKFAHDIIATCVYFAVVENVSLPRIDYREQGIFPTGFSVYPNIVDGYSDRCQAFSQSSRDHKMEPFELLDTSRPGTVLLVKLHLVNPMQATVSTANVRPSHREWIVDYTLGDVSRFFQLPTEVHDVIKSMLEWGGMSVEERRPPSFGFAFGQQTPSSSAFGQPSSQQTSFRNPFPPAPTFGAPPTGFGFGTSFTPGGFGQQAQTTGGFGQQVQSTGGFGGFGRQAQSTGGFGQARTTSGGFSFSPPRAEDVQTTQPAQGSGFRFGVEPGAGNTQPTGGTGFLFS